MTWFTADLHFCHKRIIGLTHRPFVDIKEMNEALINNFNSVVKPTDTVYILGDVGLGPRSVIEKLIKKLNGKKILIKGNHDRNFEKSGIFDHITEMEHINIDGYKIVLCHYKLEVSDKDNIIALNGHSHSTMDWNNTQIKNNLLRVDVGVDAWNYYPVSSKQIINFLKPVLDNRRISNEK